MRYASLFLSMSQQKRHVHLLKVCVGTQSVESLAQFQAARRRSAGLPSPEHMTRSRPRRSDEILNGGSLYWVIRGLIMARQRILALDQRRCSDGITRCAIILSQQIIRTQNVPRRPFQGWRYLEPHSAPSDIGDMAESEQTLPPAIESQLDQFGVIKMALTGVKTTSQ